MYAPKHKPPWEKDIFMNAFKNVVTGVPRGDHLLVLADDRVRVSRPDPRDYKTYRLDPSRPDSTRENMETS